MTADNSIPADTGEALTGAELARWCHDNPNLAARTIEGLRVPSAAQARVSQEAVDWAAGEAGKIEDYKAANPDWESKTTVRDAQRIIAEYKARAVEVARTSAQATPETDQTEHGADGKFRPAALRTKLARAAFSVLNNPGGVETLDWQIADAVLAALPSPPAPLPAGKPSNDDDRPLPIYGQIPWKQLGRDVMDVIYAKREDYEFDQGYYPGHQMVPQINFNSLARIVDKYRYYALASPPHVQIAGEVRPLDWLAAHTNYELSFNGGDEDPMWQLHSVNGGRNDREWTLRATGSTPEEALRKAMTSTVSSTHLSTPTEPK